MKTLLIYPPSWTSTLPHLATPALTAYLRAHGHLVVQRDLNLEVVEQVLSAENLRHAYAETRRRFERRAGRRHASGPRPAPDTLAWAHANGARLAEEVEEAVAVVRSEAFYEGPVGRRALQTVAEALQLASLPYFPAYLDLSTYASSDPGDRSDTLLRAARDPRANVFYEVIERYLIAGLVAEDPGLIGISISTMAQTLASLTIAYLLRRHGYRGHITVGGPHITMLREQLPKVPALFEWVDSAIVFNGERPLLALVEAMEAGSDLASVPNLIYRAGREIRTTACAPPVPLGALPDPDFGGLPLGRYLAPEPVLPLLTARGCYHGECAFCNVGYGEPERYHQLSAERVVEQMLRLHRRYGVRHVFLADEAISPRNMRGVAEGLIEERADIHWTSCARLDRALTADLLQLAVRGGCRMLLYGLETAAPRVAEAMHKGTTVDEMSRVLREGAGAGIWNHVFFFFGFPGETMEDAQETVNFLYAHAESIHSAALGTFLLERYAPAEQQPQRYGISRVAPTGPRDLAIYFDYQVASGIDEDVAEKIVARLMDALPIKPYPHYYVHDTYRFLYAARLAERGERLPTWLGSETHSR